MARVLLASSTLFLVNERLVNKRKFRASLTRKLGACFISLINYFFSLIELLRLKALFNYFKFKHEVLR